MDLLRRKSDREAIKKIEPYRLDFLYEMTG